MLEVRHLFRDTFGGDPEVVASAPGRVNLIGEHLDYNGGEVLPMAIGKRTWVAMRARPGGNPSRAVSASFPQPGEFAPSSPSASGEWWDYIAGIGSLPGKTLPSVDVAVTSDVPVGAGLSSSAALEVAAGVAYAALTGGTTDPRSIALDGWHVENEFVGVQSGIMDQFACALSREGHALHVWCDTTDTEHVPFGETVLIFDTAVARSLLGSEFNTRRAECEEAFELIQGKFPHLRTLAEAVRDQIKETRLPATLEKRALHVAGELERVHSAVDQLRQKGTIDPDVLYRSHASLRDLYECSSPELDWFVDVAGKQPGVEGARMTGAGWGGCAIAFGERAALEAAGEEIARQYEHKFAREPRFWLTKAAPGARAEA